MEYCVYTANKFLQVIDPTVAKVCLAALLSITFFFGNLYTQGLIAIVMLLVFDTVLGVAATYHEQQPITSRKFGRVILKGIIYLSSISAAYFADLTIPYDFIQATMIAFVGMTEFVSVLENIGRLGFSTPKKLLNQLNNRINNT